MNTHWKKIYRLRRRKVRRTKPNYSLVGLLVWVAVCSIFAIGTVSLLSAVPASASSDGEIEPILGIDLGTTYSVVGVFKNGKVEIIANDQGNRITPSYVAFTSSGERLVGDGAKSQVTANPKNTIFDVKRFIGRSYSEPSVLADKKMLPYNIRDVNGKPTIEVSLDDSASSTPLLFAPEEISAAVLQKMKTTAETFLGRSVNKAVITVPAYFNDAQKQATKDAGAIAGLQVERLLTEPTAAAIAYGFDSDKSSEKNLLVFDFGGGTFDVSVLQVDGGVFEVLATNGDSHLGGEDVDERIMTHCAKSILKQHGVDVMKDKTAQQKLRREAERVKRALSSQTTARLEVEDLVEGVDYSEVLTRARFEDINGDLFKKTLDPVRNALADADLETSDIDEIIFVGGSTRIPKVRQLVTDYFGGKEPVAGVNPDEAVAYGAAMQGGVLSGEPVADEIIVIDITPISTGIETVGGIMTKLIERGTHIPTKKRKVFSTNEDNQSAVTIQVFEGERAMTKDNHSLGRFELTGIPMAPRGVPQIEITFEVDSNGILSCTAKELGSGRMESITITAEKGRLSQADIDAMLDAAEKYEMEDKILKERVEARLSLESYLYGAQRSLDEDGVELDPDQRKMAMDEINESLDWLESNPEASKHEVDDARKSIENILNPVIRGAYQASSGSDGFEEWYGDDEL